MIVYRLVRSIYKDDFSGHGAFLYGGRWNSKGVPAVYCSECISLAALEIVVNYSKGSVSLLPSYHLLEIEIPDNMVLELDFSALKKSWQRDTEYSQYIGDQFLQSNAAIALKVSSAVIPEESNFLLNPHHKHFGDISVKRSRAYDLDHRLF